MDADERQPLHDYYELGRERERLDTGVGAIEFARTKETVTRHLPPVPCTVADIGGGPGRFTVWLAGLGCRVHHRDLVPLHVEQAAAAAAAGGLDGADAAVGDALDVDLPDAAVDAVLLLGPMYHLSRRSDRLRALREARRIVRPGGVTFVAAISRWAVRVHGVLADQLYLRDPRIIEELPHIERTGELETARAIERVPELLGIGPHLIATARRPSDDR